MEAAEPAEKKPAGQFQATRWSIVLAARERASPEGEAALGWLCERYWEPLRAWARARGLPPEDAEDLVQSFFEQAVRGGLVGSADAARGRFRTYLLGCLEHHWTDLRRRSSAQKRGGGCRVIALDAADSDSPAGAVASGRTPAQEYDRVWAASLLDRAAARLAAECDADGHAGRYEVLRVFLDGERGEVPLAAAAERLGLSLPAVKSAVYRLRQRLGEMVREEIRDTVCGEADVEAELRELFLALRS